MRLRTMLLAISWLASPGLARAQAVAPEPPDPPLAVEAPPVAPAPTPAPTEAPADTGVTLKLYGDTQFSYRNRGAVKTTFEAAHLDLFFTYDVGRVAFLSEVFLEGRETNEVAVDVERLQIAYLFSNALRVRAGRSHTAFGYYSDTYHHGNLFELTTERPLGIAFEDEGGLLPAHIVGVGADGTFEGGAAGALRYDVEIGNGRLADPSAVAVSRAGKNEKMLNVRLRWITPIDGFLIGVNGMYDVVPARADANPALARNDVVQAMVGAHAVYTEHGVHMIAEGYLLHDTLSGGSAYDTWLGFVELGYRFGAFTPYLRPEYILFPRAGDPIFQQADGPWAATRTVFDARVGVKWVALPQLALKLEVDRVAHDTAPQESVNVKAAFGF